MVVAYLDPGAGSLLIQAALAGLLAIPFFLRTRIGSLIRRIRPGNRPGESTSDQG